MGPKSTVFVVLLLVVLTVAAARAAEPFELLFGPHEKGAAEGLDNRFIQLVGAARQTLDLCFYEIRLDSIVDAIIAAHRKGVRVRFLVDDTNYYAKGVTKKGPRAALNPFVKRLVEAGIEVKNDQDRRSIMHNKFAVVDGARVWTGSYNLTDTCSYANCNNALIIESSDAARIFTRQFEEMFVKNEWGPRRTSTVSDQYARVGTELVEILFAPEDNPLRREIELLASATRSVHFMNFAFTSDDVSKLLIHKKTRKQVEVKGIFDHQLLRATGPYSEFSSLTAAGIPAIVYSRPNSKFHHKVFIIDAGTDNACVFTGSENCSANGNYRNDENVVVIRNRAFVDRFEAEFQRMFGTTSKATADAVVSEPAVAGGTLGRLDLFVFTNGETLSAVKVRLPARWKFEKPALEGMVATIAGEAVDPSKIAIKGQEISFSDLDLQACGPRAMLTVRFQEVEVAQLPGSYSPLVSVSQTAGGAVVPVDAQPVITVYDPESPNPLEDQAGYVLSTLSSIMLVSGSGSVDPSLKKTGEDQLEAFYRASVGAVQSKRWNALTGLVTHLKDLEENERKLFSHATDKLRPLREALTAEAASTPEAKLILDQLTEVVGR